MLAKILLPALAAVGVSAMPASSSSDICTQDTFNINSQADITKLGTCSTLKGNVTIGTSTDAELDFGTIQTINGDLTCTNNGGLSQLKGASLSSITGQFHLQNLTQLNSINFPSLTNVGTILWQALTAIDSLVLTSGIQHCKSVTVSDTHLSSLDGLDMVSAGEVNIDNNFLLVEYTSKLSNLTDGMTINANGLNFKLSFPSLIWIANMTISNVSSFDAPSLSTVNGSMRFDSNYFTSFSAPNLTSVTSGDVSFVSNSKLANVTMPALTAVGGGFLIANNTALQQVNGFGKLKTVGGAVKLRGNFTDVEFPALTDVRGTFDVVSTADITASCNTLAALAPQSQGGHGQIEGSYNCKPNVANANSDTSSGSNGTSGSGDKNSAAGVGLNMAYVLGLTAMGAVFQFVL